MEQRNLLLAIVLSLAILIGFQFVFPPAPPSTQSDAPQQTTEGSHISSLSTEPGAPGGIAVPSAPSREDAIGISPRVSIETQSLTGSIALRGARLDDLTLKG